MTDTTAMPIARPLIRAESCQRCKWAAAMPAGGWQCRRYPPTAAVVANSRGGFGTVSDFPPTGADSWCGEFAVRIEGMS